MLLAAFVPTFLEHVRTSKVAEATDLLAMLHAHAVAYYEAEHVVSSQRLQHCLPDGAGPYPVEPSSEPVPVDFAADEQGRATWSALGLIEAGALARDATPQAHAPAREPKVQAQAPAREARLEERPLRYSYEVSVPEPGCRERPSSVAITFRAIGDLDGDGNHSLLERSAAPTSDRRSLVARGPLRIVARTE